MVVASIFVVFGVRIKNFIKNDKTLIIYCYYQPKIISLDIKYNPIICNDACVSLIIFDIYCPKPFFAFGYFEQDSRFSRVWESNLKIIDDASGNDPHRLIIEL